MDLWFTENQTDGVRFSFRVDKQLFSGSSEYQEVEIYETPGLGKVLVIDGVIMVTEKDEFIYHEMIAHVPMAANPHIEKVLVIGGGDGGTVRELVKYSTIEKIDLVEIDEMVVAACKEHMESTSGALDDPRVNMYFIDGIEFVKNKKGRYDLIIVDSTDPFGPGEGLFSNEFYSNCHSALTEKGILINQSESPFYQRLAEAFKSSHDRIKGIFEKSYVYQFHMPTYPSGHWLFGFSSKGVEPLEEDALKAWSDMNIDTKYYCEDIQRGAFMLPKYVQELMRGKQHESK